MSYRIINWAADNLVSISFYFRSKKHHADLQLIHNLNMYAINLFFEKKKRI